jgi:predicted ATPase/DNA-binding SARP family transcriptional activator/Tfp pilus assembly protein PilF
MEPQEFWRIQILGQVRAERADRVVERFRTRKTGALLAYLALNLPRTHTREALIEMLWPEGTLRAGRKSLGVALSSLRRDLEPPGTPPGSVLIADHTRVRLHSGAVRTDVAEFEADLRRAQNAAPRERVSLLQQATRRYRGELLPGYDDEWVLRERERLAERYLLALRELAGALEAAGDLAAALDAARRAVLLDPLREEAHLDVMRLLAATGQSSALQAQWREMERALREELGEAPSPETRDRFKELRAAASALPPPPRPHPPNSFSPPSLPIPLTRFFGRREEIEQLSALLGHEGRPDVRLLTLTGVGGSGKTRLALETARLLQETSEARVSFVPLADVADARLLPGLILDALGIDRSASAEPMEQAVQALEQQPTLLVLDNFEHLVAGEGLLLVRVLLERAASLVCLVTSRQRLNLEGEREFTVPPLPTPTAGNDPAVPEALLRFPSVQLFVDRAQAARREFRVTPGNAAALAAVCERLEGIPLALELAAARAAVLSPEQMREHLEHRFDLLAGRRRDAPERQRTLRGAMDWSYGLLPPEQQRLFVRLSVFRGGWSLPAAAAVARDDRDEDLAPWEMLDRLQQLREASLLVAEESPAEGEIRFRMLEIVRQYAAERLHLVGETQRTRDRHLLFFRAFAEEAAEHLSGPLLAPWLERLEADHDNLRAALVWSQEGEAASPEEGLRLAAALGRFWHIRSHPQEGRQWLEALLAAAEKPKRTQPISGILRARALTALGTLSERQCDYAAAGSQHAQSLALFRELSNRAGTAQALSGLGSVAMRERKLERAQELYAESVALWQEIGDREGRAEVLKGLGNVAIYRRDYGAARGHYEESLALWRDLSDPHGTAIALNNLGAVAVYQGDYAAARAFFEESLALQRGLGNRWGAAICLSNLGIVALNQNDLPAAAAYYEGCLALHRELSDPRGALYALNGLGLIATYEKRYAAARALFEECLSQRRAWGDRAETAVSLYNLGAVATIQGDLEAARSFLEESLILRREIGDRHGIEEGLRGFAELEYAEHRPERAARLIGAAEALRDALGTPLPVRDRATYDDLLGSVRSRLTREAFARAHAQGRALSPEQAVAYALEPRSSAPT